MFFQPHFLRITEETKPTQQKQATQELKCRS